MASGWLSAGTRRRGSARTRAHARARGLRTRSCSEVVVPSCYVTLCSERAWAEAARGPALSPKHVSKLHAQCQLQNSSKRSSTHHNKFRIAAALTSFSAKALSPVSPVPLRPQPQHDVDVPYDVGAHLVPRHPSYSLARSRHDLVAEAQVPSSLLCSNVRHGAGRLRADK